MYESLMSLKRLWCLKKKKIAFNGMLYAVLYETQ